MNNLFSIFDPTSSFLSLSLNWLSTTLGLLFLPQLFWGSYSRWSFLWTKITETLYKEFNSLLSCSHKGINMLMISLFTFVLFNNFLGLLPYVFTSSSHMTLTLTLSLPLWLTLMIFGWLTNSKSMLAHLVPQGTPFILMPFMVIIETISNIIRPLTLAIRLAANMIAGHLLLTLLGGVGPSMSLMILSFLIISQILLLTLETAVAIIQSYVFAVLSTLYTSEIN